MSRYCISTPEVKKQKKILFKYNSFSIQTKDIRGKIFVNGWRKYNYYSEVDIIFQGEIHVKYNGKQLWLDSSILNRSRVSKIKCNKLIRRFAFFTTRHYLSYFSISLRSNQFTIKKVKWI